MEHYLTRFYKTTNIYTVVAIMLFPFVLLNCSFPVATPLSVLMVTLDLEVSAVVLCPISFGSSSGLLLVVTPRGRVLYLSEFRLRGNTEFSRCNVALTSLPAAQVQAFRKLFLKLSDRNAYRIGFMAELEYESAPAMRNTMTVTELWH